MRHGIAIAVVASTLAAVAACTSFDAPGDTTTAEDGGNDTTTTPPSDAGAETALLQSDPGVVACNPAGDVDDRECRTNSEAGCCYPAAGPRCNKTCTNPWIRCDETADCEQGSRCCGSLTLDTECSAIATSCLTQICKDASECNGAPCDAYECFGRIIGVCSNSTKTPPPTQCTRK